MLGRLLTDHDIHIYLNDEEIDSLAAQTLEGFLIQDSRPRTAHLVRLWIDDEYRRIGAQGMVLESDSETGYAVVISTRTYQELRERGSFGVRPLGNTLGSFVHLFDYNHGNARANILSIEVYVPGFNPDE